MRALLHVDDEDAMAFVFVAAVREGNIQATVHRVADGAQALAYLRVWSLTLPPYDPI